MNLTTLTAAADEPVNNFDLSLSCSNAKNYKCEGKCDDGFGLDCYYDSRSTKFDNKRSLYLEKAKCFGSYDTSVCDPCRNQYRIEDKDLSCEEFYKALNEFNQKCRKCLRKRSEFAG